MILQLPLVNKSPSIGSTDVEISYCSDVFASKKGFFFKFNLKLALQLSELVETNFDLISSGNNFKLNYYFVKFFTSNNFPFSSIFILKSLLRTNNSKFNECS